MDFNTIAVDDFRTHTRLSGKKRLRSKTRLFREPLFVLQVEVEISYVNWDFCNRRISRKWRDAVMTDFLLNADIGTISKVGDSEES